LTPRKHWRQQNIGADKIHSSTKLLASTKYWCQQNIGVDKILALAKYGRQQNLGVDKKLVQTKCWRRRRIIPLLFGSAESAAADFSQTSLKISYVSLMVLLSLHAVVKCGVASSRPAFLWADFLPYCTVLLYRPAMLKTSQILTPTKYRRPPKITDFCENYISPYI
jgi:hypothetical protein